MLRLVHTAVTGVALALSFFAALLLVSGRASAATPRPATPTGLPAAIEAPAAYVEQTACDPVARPGTVRLARLLATTYRSYAGTSWASTYGCGTDGTRSEHYDGRAIDWMVGVRNASQRAAATAAIQWLLATDARGNRTAMARRLGVMYLIWNNRIWGAWDGRWHEYDGCATRTSRADDNACHRTHVHISLSWNGAMGRTSFWTRRVSPTDFGPCRPRDLNWAYRYAAPNDRGCPSYPRIVAPSGASATKKALVAYSGAAVRRGWSGPAVAAVQRAVHVAASGSYGAATVVAVQAFQRARHLVATGAMNVPTWRAMLAATR